MEIKNNAIYYYDDVRGNWCTHGIVFTVTRNGIMYAIDTYNRQDIEKYKAIDCFTEFDKVWEVEDIKNNLEYIMDIDDIQEVDKRTFDIWCDKDKVYIPIGTWHDRYLVNKNKGIDMQNEIYILTSEIKSLEWSIENQIKELKEKKSRLKQINDIEDI